MPSVILVVAESRLLPSKRIEDKFQLQHNSFCLQCTAEVLENLGTLNSFVATGFPVPEFSSTVCELVDVLVEFVFSSESGVTCLAHWPPKKQCVRSAMN